MSSQKTNLSPKLTETMPGRGFSFLVDLPTNVTQTIWQMNKDGILDRIEKFARRCNNVIVMKGFIFNLKKLNSLNGVHLQPVFCLPKIICASEKLELGIKNAPHSPVLTFQMSHLPILQVDHKI
ncbi:hypothetical protein TNCV_481471 [Trichonephila clavipes]|nr:hypothetical protein TNCV_481471 [Trichonephila clavipes]